MAAKEQQDAIATRYAKTLHAMNAWIDAREESEASISVSLPSLASIHKELASLATGKPDKYRVVEVDLRKLRKHHRKEFSLGQKDAEAAYVLYRYGTIALDEDFLESLRAQTGAELQPTKRWNDISQVSGHFHSTTSLERSGTKSARKRPTKLSKRALSTESSNKPPRESITPEEATTPSSISSEWSPEANNNALVTVRIPSPSFGRSFKRQRDLRNDDARPPLPTSASSVPASQTIESQAVQRALDQYLTAGETMHGLVSGQISSSMEDILGSCEDATTKYLDHLGLSNTTPFLRYPSKDIEQVTELGNMLFEHNDRVSWIQSALNSSSHGISNGHLTRGFLQAFIFQEIFQATYPLFLHPHEQAIKELDDGLKEEHLYGFYQYIRRRRLLFSLTSPFYEKQAKDTARQLAIIFHNILKQLVWQECLLPYLTTRDHYWDNTWEDELASIFSKCLELRAKISLDLHQREVIFSLPLSGQDFIEKEMVEEDRDSRCLSTNRPSRKIQIALGPLIATRPVCHGATSYSQAGIPNPSSVSTVFRKALVHVC